MWNFKKFAKKELISTEVTTIQRTFKAKYIEWVNEQMDSI